MDRYLYVWLWLLYMSKRSHEQTIICKCETVVCDLSTKGHTGKILTLLVHSVEAYWYWYSTDTNIILIQYNILGMTT